MQLGFWVHALLLPLLAGSSVVIEAPPADAEYLAAALESCNHALGAGICRAPGDAPAGAHVRVRIVFLDRERRRAQVELFRGGDDDAPTRVRSVEFASEDGLRQRYRALGVIIASHVLASEPRERPAPRAPAPAPGPRLPAPSPPPARAPLGFAADLGALAGPGLDRGGPRLGAFVRGRLEIAEFPAAPFVALRAAQRFEQPVVYWLSSSVGLALALAGHDAPVGVELRAAFVAQRTTAEATDADTGAHDRGGEWQLGGRVGIDLLFPVHPTIAITIGAEGELVRPSVYLTVSGAAAGGDPALAWAGLAGVRLRP